MTNFDEIEKEQKQEKVIQSVAQIYDKSIIDVSSKWNLLTLANL